LPFDRQRGVSRLLPLAAMLLQACATTTEAPVEPVPAAAPEPEPELILNLPDGSSPDCVPAPDRDFTFLDKGLASLAAGDHIEAVTYFQRYQRLESSPEADWEASIAIAYDSMLTQSPFYDPPAALMSFKVLQDITLDEQRIHPKILIMRDALTTLSGLQAQIEELQGDNARLTENLAKREEALKRLRELTLGQKAATP
jgi:hypothetical protein